LFFRFGQRRFVEEMFLEVAEFAVARHAAVLNVELHYLCDDVFAVRAIEFRECLGFDFAGFDYDAVEVENDGLPVEIFHD
jgi:hypothetical protein